MLIKSGEGGVMNYEKIKKAVVSLALAGGIILSAGAASDSQAQAQGRWQRDRWERRDDRRWDNDQYRRWHRQELERARRLDRQQQLRYRYQNSNRIVGYYDRFGRFHAYGYYDRFGRFFRY
jgi:hypothetical protein